MIRPKCKYCGETMLFAKPNGARYAHACPNCGAEYRSMAGNKEGCWTGPLVSYQSFREREGLNRG